MAGLVLPWVTWSLTFLGHEAILEKEKPALAAAWYLAIIALGVATLSLLVRSTLDRWGRWLALTLGLCLPFVALFARPKEMDFDYEFAHLLLGGGFTFLHQVAWAIVAWRRLRTGGEPASADAGYAAAAIPGVAGAVVGAFELFRT